MLWQCCKLLFLCYILWVSKEWQKQKFEALQQKISGHSNKGQHICRDNMTVDTRKWVKKLSDTPLTAEQERLLAQGPHYVIRPKKPPVREYVVAVEQACSRLSQGEADELRVEAKKTLKKIQNKSKTTSTMCSVILSRCGSFGKLFLCLLTYCKQLLQVW